MASSDGQFPSSRPPAHSFPTRGSGQVDPHRQPRYVPNDQEARVLLECQKESFYYRALPMGLLAGSGVFALIQRGVLTTKTRFGPLPKVFFGGFCGYVLGKMSYISTCKQKFLKLENSPIADMLRKGGSPGAIAASTQFGVENWGSQPISDQSMYPSGGGTGNANISDDYSANLDIDTSYGGQDVSLENYDQSQHVNIQGEISNEKKPQMTMTYDQLRKENREKTSQQYREVLPGHYMKNQPSEPEPSKAPLSNRVDDDEFTLGRSKKLRRNAYGDLISDE